MCLVCYTGPEACRFNLEEDQTVRLLQLNFIIHVAVSSKSFQRSLPTQADGAGDGDE